MKRIKALIINEGGHLFECLEELERFAEEMAASMVVRA